MNKGALGELEQAFPGFVFRNFDGAKFEFLRWQAGRTERERRVVPASIATGYIETELKVSLFRLVAFAATAAELAEQLKKLDPARPFPLAQKDANGEVVRGGKAAAESVSAESPPALSASAETLAAAPPAGYVELLG